MTKYAHGTRDRYRNGCHCGACRQAHTDYWYARNDWMRGRGKAPVTDADEARRHLMGLTTRSLTMAVVSRATGVPRSLLMDIVRRKVKTITARTGVAILGFDAEDLDRLPDDLVLPSKAAWARFDRLCERMGWTRRQAAQAMGYARGMTRRPGITVQNARKIRDTYIRFCGIRCAICGEPLGFHRIDRRCKGRG